LWRRNIEFEEGGGVFLGAWVVNLAFWLKKWLEIRFRVNFSAKFGSVLGLSGIKFSKV